MTTFSPTQYESVVNDLVSGGNTLSGQIRELPPAANKTLSNPWVPGWIKTSIKWLVEKACAVGLWVLDKIVELLKGAVAPYGCSSTPGSGLRSARRPQAWQAS